MHLTLRLTQGAEHQDSHVVRKLGNMEKQVTLLRHLFPLHYKYTKRNVNYQEEKQDKLVLYLMCNTMSIEKSYISNGPIHKLLLEAATSSSSREYSSPPLPPKKQQTNKMK